MPVKKLFILTLIWLACISVSLRAQTIYWAEEFNSGQGNWSLEDNWSVTTGMLQFYWTPNWTNFDLSAVSPLITLPENIAELTVIQYLDVFSGTGNEFAEINIRIGSESFVLWNYNLVGGNWGNATGSELIFPLSEYAGQDVQVEFRTYGIDTYNWNWWNVFEIKMSAMFEKDLAVDDISGPVTIDILEQGTWTVDVKNYGSQPQSGYSVKLFCHKTGNMIGNVEVTETLSPQETASYSFQWSSNAAYNTAFYGVVELEGDVFAANNISKSNFVRIDPGFEFDILVWDYDNAIQTVTCPEEGDLIEPSAALMRALDVAGYDYNVVNSLPADLLNYEIVFSTMGCYCVD
jgi:hypothetical protein